MTTVRCAQHISKVVLVSKPSIVNRTALDTGAYQVTSVHLSRQRLTAEDALRSSLAVVVMNLPKSEGTFT